MSGASSSTLTGRFVYVYDGRQCLGHVVNRGVAGFEAFDRDDRSAGIFPTQAEAAAALSVPR
jgi:hypothetical protein